MDKFIGSYDGSASTTRYFGKEIDSSFACEPAEAYGIDDDEEIYQVDVISPDMPNQHIRFNSLEQILEFNMHFNRYLDSLLHRKG